MELSREGLMAIASHEGIVLRPYRDSVGVLTIGIGHTKAAGHPDPASFRGELTLSEALGLFRHDVSKYAAAVSRAVKVPLKQHEFDALVSWHYNTGAVGKASLIKKLNAGDKAGAAKGLLDWRKPPEIMPRRRTEHAMFTKGVYPAFIGNIYPVGANGKPVFSRPAQIDLRKAFAAPPVAIPPVTGPESLPPFKPRPEPVSAPPSGLGALVAAVIAACVAGLTYIGGLPCQWFGWFCGG